MCSRNRPWSPEQGSTTDASYESQEKRPLWKLEFKPETLTKSINPVAAVPDPNIIHLIPVNRVYAGRTEVCQKKISEDKYSITTQ